MTGYKHFGDNWDEIVQNWYFGISPNITEEAFTEGINHLHAVWPERIHSSINSNFKGPFNISYVVDTASILLKCAKMEGFEKVLKKLKANTPDSASAFSELYVASELISMGYEIEFERENSIKKRPDLATCNLNPMFIEVISPNRSQGVKEVIDNYYRLLNKITKIGLEMKVNILCSGELTNEIEVKILEFLKNKTEGYLKTSDDSFLLVNNKVENSDFEIPEALPKQRLGLNIINVGTQNNRAVERVHIKTFVLDERISKFIGKEREHFAKEDVNLLVIDITELPAQPEIWIQIIKKNFQPNLNTRISAICFYRRGSVSSEVRSQWWCVTNPFAKQLLPKAVEEKLQALQKPLF